VRQEPAERKEDVDMAVTTNPISTIQERFVALEAEARGRIVKALTQGNEKLRDLDQALARVSREDWTVPGMRRHLGELKVRAENIRATAVKRAQEIPGEAVSALASGTRAPVQNLAKGLARMAKKIEPPKPKGPKAVEAKPVEAKAPKAEAKAV
jgi:hypothetical protein